MKNTHLMAPSYQPRGVNNAHNIEVFFPPNFVDVSVPVSNVFEIFQWLRKKEQMEAIHSTCRDSRAEHVVHVTNAGIKFQDARADDEIADQGVGEGAEEVPWRRWVKAEQKL